MAGVAVAALASVLCADVLTAEDSQAPAAVAPSGDAGGDRRLLQQYCVGCHNDRTKTGGLTLEAIGIPELARNVEVGEKVLRKLRAGLMPPPGRPGPDSRARLAFVTSLEQTIDSRAAASPDPGRSPVFHRLNRAEYQNAVRDLLALDMDVAQWLPPDDQNFGFDNNGEALAFSPLLLDRYLSAARRISRAAVGSPSVAPLTDIFEVPGDVGQDDRLDGLPYGTRGGMMISYWFPLDADYEISIRLARNYSGQIVDMYEPHQLEVLVDGERVHSVTVAPPPGPRQLGVEADDNLRFRVPIRAGTRQFAVTFVRRSSAQPNDERLPFLRGDANLSSLHGQPWLGTFTITGPFNPSPMQTDTPSQRRIFICRASAPAEESPCATRLLSTLARRGYRRAVGPSDLRPLVSEYEAARAEGEPFERGIDRALQRLLLSPAFLFRIELPPAHVAPGAVYRADDFALASRLSFFLWSTIPDDELLDLAEQGRLGDGEVLEQQVRRMLADPRAGTLATRFADQWLEIRRLEEVAPDPKAFPNFDRNLREALRRETHLFFDAIVRENRPLRDLLTADFTFVNERLARHYGIPGIYGDRFRRVSVEGPRAGLLGHASILAITSYPARTSPVQRGIWILTNLLGVPPPDPPPNVPNLPDAASSGRVLTMRERMEAHRRNPTCASCHAVMDPLGLPLEQFDAVGAWRVRSEAGERVDASGALPDGTVFEGVDGLRAVLLHRLEEFHRTLVEKMLTYALGRGVGAADMPVVRAILREAARDDYRAQSVVLAVVRSLPFQLRRTSVLPDDGR
jgi:hypothetical protein